MESLNSAVRADSLRYYVDTLKRAAGQTIGDLDLCYAIDRWARFNLVADFLLHDMPLFEDDEAGADDDAAWQALAWWLGVTTIPYGTTWRTAVRQALSARMAELVVRPAATPAAPSETTKKGIPIRHWLRAFTDVSPDHRPVLSADGECPTVEFRAYLKPMLPPGAEAAAAAATTAHDQRYAIVGRHASVRVNVVVMPRLLFDGPSSGSSKMLDPLVTWTKATAARLRLRDLVTDWPQVVSPHFLALVDAFGAPALSVPMLRRARKLLFSQLPPPTWACYTVSEDHAGHDTLEQFLTTTARYMAAAPESRGHARALVRALQWQVLAVVRAAASHLGLETPGLTPAHLRVMVQTAAADVTAATTAGRRQVLTTLVHDMDWVYATTRYGAPGGGPQDLVVLRHAVHGGASVRLEPPLGARLRPLMTHADDGLATATEVAYAVVGTLRHYLEAFVRLMRAPGTPAALEREVARAEATLQLLEAVDEDEANDVRRRVMEDPLGLPLFQEAGADDDPTDGRVPAFYYRVQQPTEFHPTQQAQLVAVEYGLDVATAQRWRVRDTSSVLSALEQHDRSRAPAASATEQTTRGPKRARPLQSTEPTGACAHCGQVDRPLTVVAEAGMTAHAFYCSLVCAGLGTGRLLV